MALGIPYFEARGFELLVPWFGRLDVGPFGAFVTVGVLLGALVILGLARRVGFDFDHLVNLMLWTTTSGFIVAHAFHVVAYEPATLKEDPLVLLNIWGGISSLGGLLGCSAGFFGYLRKRRLRGQWRRSYVDVLVVGATLGMMIGRIGCTVVRDHPGMPTDFFLAFDFGGGDVRHNLGLYDCLWCCLVFLTLIVVRAKWKNRPRGFLAGLAPTMYATMRFFLEFLRAPEGDGGDVRYFGLTPGHYLSLVMLALGVLTIRYAFEHRDEKDPPLQELARSS